MFIILSSLGTHVALHYSNQPGYFSGNEEGSLRATAYIALAQASSSLVASPGSVAEGKKSLRERERKGGDQVAGGGGRVRRGSQKQLLATRT